jgi:putative tryptophan/tyrosine transport system substrate-binding protein
MANAGGPGALLEMQAVEEMARAAGLETIRFAFERPQEIAAAFDTFKGRADALYVAADPVTGTYRVRINTLALQARLPTIFSSRENVEAGGFASYGPNFSSLFRRGADFVDKILRGSKPADIPVEQPTKFDLVVNLTTAKALDLTIPESFLLRADEVIE